jgi:hypothetical protein
MENINLNPEFEDPLEIFKLSKDDAHLYKLLPMSTAEGHTTTDFDELIFRGKMKMTIKGELALVYFVNANNTLAYVCVVNQDIDKCVSRCRDSGRYFALRAMTDKGQPAYLGLGNYAI